MKITKVVKYLKYLNSYRSDSVLFMAMLVKIAEIGGLNNISAKSTSIDTPDNTTPANLYAITFLDSSGGKDKPLRDIDKNLCNFIDDDFNTRSLDSYEYRKEKVESEAKALFSDNEKEQKKYMTANRPRQLVREFSDATLEGFVAMRQEYYKAEWGGTFIRISEFGDYITSDNTARAEFLSMLTEVYDHGDNNSKVTKGERENITVKGVPSSAILHTSPAGLLEGKNRTKLFNFFNRGIARRSFICYPEETSVFKTGDINKLISERMQGKEKAKEMEDEVSGFFKDFYNTTKPDDHVIINSNNIFEYTDEAETMIERYEVTNAYEARSMKESTETSGIKSELSGRHWKALKLAALIASFEHPADKRVHDTDVSVAIGICDDYAVHLMRFYQAKPTTPEYMLFEYFKENEGKWIPGMTIYDQGFVRKTETPAWLNKNLPIVVEMLESSGYSFEEEPHGSRGRRYRVNYESLVISDEGFEWSIKH